MPSKAWMLSQDGKAYPVKVHQYVIGDDDLFSEGESASFLVKTIKSKPILYYKVIDACVGMYLYDMIDQDTDPAGFENDLRSAAEEVFGEWEYHITVDSFMKIHESIGSYNNYEELTEYLKKVHKIKGEWSDTIKNDLNQLFCRVRYGGQYDTSAGSNEIWFRISSVGFDWYNNIYMFLADNKRSLNIQYVNVCRDYESDNGFMSKSGTEYFYKAKNGVLYKNMPINEFMNEENGLNPEFESIKFPELPLRIMQYPRQCMYKYLSDGNPISFINEEYKKAGFIGVTSKLIDQIRREEISRFCAPEKRVNWRDK